MNLQDYAAIRTPLDESEALQLGNRVWRKEVLRAGTLHYRGDKIQITPQYLDEIVAAFREGAIGSVPFTFVDGKGEHAESPELRKGAILGLERAGDSLKATIALDPDADALVDRDRRFGVSVLVKHNRTTGGGKHYPAVLAHVAGTYDPVINDLGDWEEIAASHDGGQVLDLLALSADVPADEQDDNRSDNGGPPVADTLTPDELAALRSLASVAPQLVAQATAQDDGIEYLTGDAVEDGPVYVDEVDDDTEGGRQMSDADIAEMLRTLDPEGVMEGDAEGAVDEREPIAASSGPSDEVLALTQQLAEAQQRDHDRDLRLAQVESELAARNYIAERDQMAREFGIHPAVTDIIRPLLEGRGVGHVALSHGDGQRVDVAATVRRFARELARRPRLDLSQASGSPVDLTDDDQGARDRDLEQFLAQAHAERNG